MPKTTAASVLPLMCGTPHSSRWITTCLRSCSARSEPARASAIKKERISESAWRVRGNGACPTIRFDDTTLFPDFIRSKNVIGFQHFQDALYVHLGDSAVSDIALTKLEPSKCYLKQGSHQLQDYAFTETSVSFRTQGYGRGFFIFANCIPSKSYHVRLGQRETTLTSNATGELRIEIEMQGSVFIQAQLAAEQGTQ